jgi:hypothetical protein
MRYMMIVPYHDLCDEQPQTIIDFIESGTDEEAKRLVVDIAKDAKQLMDMVVPEWRRDHPELKGLEDEMLFEAYGITFGIIDVWRDTQFVAWVEPLTDPFAPPPAPPAAGLSLNLAGPMAQPVSPIVVPFRLVK